MPPDDYKQLYYRLFRCDGACLGNAWAVTSNELVTCAHVVRGIGTLVSACRPFLSDSDMEYRRAQLPEFCVVASTGYDDPTQDATLLRRTNIAVETDVQTSLGMGICDPEPGQHFITFGYPLGYDQLGQFAHYSVGAKLPCGFFQVQVANTVSPRLQEGYSGSPVWDMDLHCILGVVVGLDRILNGASAYILPPSYLRSKIGQPSADIPPVIGSRFYERLERAAVQGPARNRAARCVAWVFEETIDPEEHFWGYQCLDTLWEEPIARQVFMTAYQREENKRALRAAEAILCRRGLPLIRGEYNAL